MSNTETDALVQKLRYMGQQYAAGQASRGGSPRKHYLEEAADTIERLTRERDEAVADAARYRYLRQRHKALCRMYTAIELGLDLSTFYVDTPEKLDYVVDAAIRTTKAPT